MPLQSRRASHDVPLIYCATCNTGYMEAFCTRCPYCHGDAVTDFVDRWHNQAWGRRKHLRSANPADGPYVNADAKYRDGVAALGVVGLLGTHAKVVDAASSVIAEIAAVEYAMELAAGQGIEKATFRTDCVSAAHASKRTPRMADLMRTRPLWLVKCVPRRQNASAHSVAGRAWREAGLR